jgi:hypothetical protein
VAALRGLLGRLLPARPPRRRSQGVQPAAQARDYSGPARISYAPHPDGVADPGEVVWTWVPYEDDPRKGKDRPVVVVARVADFSGRSSSRSASLRSRQPSGDLLVVMLSSKDHADDRDWLLLGRGAWDPEGRASFVRVDRVLSVDPAGVRREGATLDRPRFDALATELRRRHGWS